MYSSFGTILEVFENRPDCQTVHVVVAASPRLNKFSLAKFLRVCNLPLLNISF